MKYSENISSDSNNTKKGRENLEGSRKRKYQRLAKEGRPAAPALVTHVPGIARRPDAAVGLFSPNNALSFGVAAALGSNLVLDHDARHAHLFVAVEAPSIWCKRIQGVVDKNGSNVQAFTAVFATLHKLTFLGTGGEMKEQ